MVRIKICIIFTLFHFLNVYLQYAFPYSTNLLEFTRASNSGLQLKRLFASLLGN